MFVVKLTDFIPKTNWSTGDLSGNHAPVLGGKNQTKLTEERTFLGCKNDTNKQAVMELWISEVVKKGKDPKKRWQIEDFFPSFISI